MSRRTVLALLCAGALAATIAPVTAQEEPRRRLGAVVTPVRLVPSGSDTTAVSDLHSYFGEIELDAIDGGLVVSNRLSLERYLLGLAEVPSSWPAEGLKAQAVAARTYALHTLGQARAGAAADYGFDICASVECQVFSGADTVLGADGVRWAEAVAQTEGQAILYEGAPILARYHSVSGGQTLLNSQAFPEEGVDYPYLQPVDSTAEEASPLYRWRSEFSLRQVERMLRRALWWTDDHGRLRKVVSVPSEEGLHYPDIVFRSRSAEVRRTAQDVRELFGDLAPRMFPSQHPAAYGFGRRLPETWPANRVDVRTVGRRVVTIGRGWGHGVGMSQWGAFGLAERGASYAEILQHYYTGVSIERFDGPDQIEVGVDWGRSEVAVTGAFSVVDGRGETLVDDAVGTWRFRHADDGIATVDPPQGFGLPLRVGIARSPERIGLGEAAYLTVALSRPAHVKTSTSGSPTGYEDPGARIERAGRQRIVWLAPLEPGTYRIEVQATAGGRTVRSDPVDIEVVEPPSPPEVVGPPLRDGRSGSPTLLIVVLGVILVAVVSAALFQRLGRMKR